jgi:hypothetical protein
LCSQLLCHLQLLPQSAATAVGATSSGTRTRDAACPTAALRHLPLPPKVTTALPPITIGTRSKVAALRRTQLPPTTRPRNAGTDGLGTRTFTCAFLSPRPTRRRLLLTRRAAPAGSVMLTNALPPSAPPVLTPALSPDSLPTTMSALTPRLSSSRAVDVRLWDKVRTVPPSRARGTSGASRAVAQSTHARLVSSVLRMVRAVSRSEERKKDARTRNTHRQSLTPRSLPTQSFRYYLPASLGPQDFLWILLP